MRAAILFVYYSSRDDEEENAGITDPEGKPVDKPQDTSKTSDQSEGKEKEEEEVEFTEEEEAIKANIENEDPLSDDILNNIVPDWWHKEPFK